MAKSNGRSGWGDRALIWWLAAIGVCAAVASPMLLVEAPPLLDYLNHVARIYVLAEGAADPVLSHMYTAHWAIIPNLALDVMLIPVLHVVPPLIAGRVATACIIVLPLLGTFAYSRAIFGVRSYWPLGACLVAWNATALMGFLNFLAAIGCAMLLAALWVRDRDRHARRTVVIGCLGAIVLFFCHLMGVVLFLILIGAFELDHVLRRPGDVFRRAAITALLPLGPLVLYLLSPFGQVGGQTRFLSPTAKAMQLLVPFVSYDAALDMATAAIVLVCVAGLAFSGCLRMPRHAAIAVLTLLALYVVSPFILKGTCFLDTRFPVMLGYLLFAAIRPAALNVPAARLVGLTLTGLFVWRMATLDRVWLDYQLELDGMRAAIAEVAPGDRVYVTSVAPEEAPSYWRHAPRSRLLSSGIRLDYHLPALLVLERRAFWPYLFADPAQQPIAVLQPYRRIAEATGPILAHEQLQTEGNRLLCDYHFVLLLAAGGEPDTAHYGGERLELLHANDVAALYRVRPPIDAAVCGNAPAFAASER